MQRIHKPTLKQRKVSKGGRSVVTTPTYKPSVVTAKARPPKPQGVSRSSTIKVAGVSVRKDSYTNKSLGNQSRGVSVGNKVYAETSKYRGGSGGRVGVGNKELGVYKTGNNIRASVINSDTGKSKVLVNINKKPKPIVRQTKPRPKK